MNKDEFTEYLQNPDTLDVKSVGNLVGLINEFPYCQSTRILLTLNLFKEKDIRYDSELKTTAVYVSNRGLLRKHLDRLNIESSKVFLPDDAAVDTNKSEQGKKIEKDKAGEVKKKVDKPDQNTEDEAANIAEVKTIIERHLKELEADLNQKQKKEPVSVKKSKPVKAKQDIIDEFIKNEPSISRPKTEFYDPVDKARESVVDNEKIVSETLAGIFYDQGHIQKAIKIYQKLSLKFPEKSSYFAALIKKAEKELES